MLLTETWRSPVEFLFNFFFFLSFIKQFDPPSFYMRGYFLPSSSSLYLPAKFIFAFLPPIDQQKIV